MAAILIVDDDPSLRTVIRLVLEKGGFEVRDAMDGVAALELIQDERPDLVIADKHMPRMSGLELIRQMRAQATTGQVPVVLLSGRLDDPDPSHLADAVVAKPFEPADLLHTVRRLLENATV